MCKVSRRANDTEIRSLCPLCLCTLDIFCPVKRLSNLTPSSTMPRPRPQLSITLPKNFTFHYTEGEEPKTPPEKEIPIPVPRSPPRIGNACRVKQRGRPSLTALFPHHDTQNASGDKPLPTIETPQIVEPARPTFLQRATEPTENLFAPTATRKHTTLPRTPTFQQRRLTNDWDNSAHQDLGESISRPMSACSLLSDSSGDSNGSLLSFPAGDGSCTSPESDVADPFKFPSMRKSDAKEYAALAMNSEDIQSGLSTKQIRVNWTSEMDKHLWSIYLFYLQDPTVTPFKTLPGTAPPLGVCHRVAREARRSWRLGGKSSFRRPSDLLSPPMSEDEVNKIQPDARAGSPDTARADRSGSNTPTAKESKPPSIRVWPKSGSSTRRRLRYLCKRKPMIAPHYQRLMKSRSPSPFSSPRPQSRSQSRLSEVSSPLSQLREVQISLTTSTAATMQPDGPLARLASGPQPSNQAGNEWFNEPPVPWASTPAIPSDVLSIEQEEPVQTPLLGSPFGSHTWGPSRSRQRIRPNTSRIQSSDASTMGPSLRSPVRLHDTFQYPGVQKRRARHPLEDELSPGGSSMQQELLDNIFGTAPEGRHRRVRSRGFSLGDVAGSNPLESLFIPPDQANQYSSGSTEVAPSNNLELPSTPPQIRRLGSPIHGISPRPPHTPSRHTASASLDSYEPFSSIGETLGRANEGTLPSQMFNR